MHSTHLVYRTAFPLTQTIGSLYRINSHMSQRVCPYWMGYFLATPLRRLVQNPDKILASFVTNGTTVLEVGPAMGFFTLPLARMVGANGKVVCVDVQEKMLQSLQRRALKAGLANRICARLCAQKSLSVSDFDGKIDFALAFAVVHEIPDSQILFAEIAKALKPDAKCLVAEPKGHVSAQEFEQTVATAKRKGLHLIDQPKIAYSHTALLCR